MRVVFINSGFSRSLSLRRTLAVCGHLFSLSLSRSLQYDSTHPVISGNKTTGVGGVKVEALWCVRAWKGRDSVRRAKHVNGG